MTTRSLPNPPRLLVTAGPTQEPIDAVRFISNRSSGRMGAAIAVEGARRGWPTTLLLGPVSSGPPDCSGIRLRRFRTTADLELALQEEWPVHDVLIMAAAVADHRPRHPELGGKLRREGGPLSLELEPTPDLLRGMAPTTRPGQVVVGFALEPADRLLRSAREKLLRKGLHAVVANPLETMDSDDIHAVLVSADGTVERPPSGPQPTSKTAFAAWLLDRLPTLARQEAPPVR
ncbi:MAG: phosphopantothenoylcysteine decarboxylase [Phycisphaerales bacterium]|nr:phosphopantothenoylcysteine decarboxylase [Phycisphaerales bacterium]